MLPQAMPSGFAAHYRTSRHAGGDYYDVLRLDDNRLSFIVADVSGHGASAAIVMAMIRTLFHTLGEAAGDPETALRHIDAQFDFLRDSAVFATAAYGVIDTAHRTIRFASAGHPLPLVSRPGEGTTTLRCEGALPLLFAHPAPIPVAEHALSAGDRILVYTDGITDRQAASGDMYEVDRLAAAFTRSAPATPLAWSSTLSATSRHLPLAPRRPTTRPCSSSPSTRGWRLGAVGWRRDAAESESLVLSLQSPVPSLQPPASSL